MSKLNELLSGENIREVLKVSDVVESKVVDTEVLKQTVRAKKVGVLLNDTNSDVRTVLLQGRRFSEESVSIELSNSEIQTLTVLLKEHGEKVIGEILVSKGVASGKIEKEDVEHLYSKIQKL